ncbi:MAG: quinone-dependent dihydroorotate dehydrogenase [Lautropia sp.]
MDPLLSATWPAARALLFRLDPERAHALTMGLLDRLDAVGLMRRLAGPPVADPVTLLGLRFPNRVGLAAGLDKDAAHLPALAALGFGFLEAGTVTPKGQPGNPGPRLFRLEAAQALINRFGFNNVGLDRFLANFARDRVRLRAAGDASPVIGINIGKNLSTPLERAADDYVIGLQRAAPVADYLVVNISSPNTRDLRQLQSGDELSGLLGRIDAHRAQLLRTEHGCPPLLVKIAPDLDDAQIAHLVGALTRFSIDGVIATNTTTARTAVAGLPHGDEAGGLSGAPVTQASTRVIRALREALPSRYPIIGVGGVMCARDALDKRDAGADLVQLYTGLIYAGPGLVGECARALASRPGVSPAADAAPLPAACAGRPAQR